MRDGLKEAILQSAARDPEAAYRAVAPQLKFKADGATRLQAACPLHGSTGKTPPFKVYLEGARPGSWQCYGANGCGGGDVLGFAAKVWGLDGQRDFPAILQRLAEVLGLSPAGVTPVAQECQERRREVGKRSWQAITPEGVLVAVHQRVDFSDGKKEVWWERDGKKGLNKFPLTEMPLYNPLPRDVWDGFAGEPVVLVEGEKCADSLLERGITTLGTMCGASATPSEAILRPLVKRDVTLWPDNDDAGRAHMAAIAKRLQELGGRPNLVVWPGAPPDGGDAADHPGGGEELKMLLATAQPVPRQYSPLSIAVGMETLDQHIGELEWLWEGYIPLSYLTVMGGDTGLGKSTFLLYLIQAAAGYANWPDGQPPWREKRCVLYMDGEGRQGMTRDRVRKLGFAAEAYRFPGEDGLAVPDITKPEWLEGLRDMIDRYRPIMVVLDPFQGLHSEDGNSAKINRPLLDLHAMGRAAHAAIVLIHERRKEDRQFGKPEMGLDDFLGSKQLVQRAVSVIAFEKADPESYAVRFKPLKSNWGPLAPPLGYIFYDDGMHWCSPPMPHREETATDRATAWLITFLQAGAQAEVAVLQHGRSLGHKDKPLRNAQTNLHIRTWTDDHGVTRWGLPEKHLRWEEDVK